jgi:hypothetical protein
MPKYLFGIILILLFGSCKKEMADYASLQITDYYPLQEGKYITYNLDSTVFLKFGTTETVIHYQVKDSVDKEITDNSGRKAFRIIRYIRKDSLEDWRPNNTFMAIPTDNSLEFVEDNMRFIKLKLPFREGFTWKGNNYLSDDSYHGFDFASDFLTGWDYIYQDVSVPAAINGINFDTTITVFQRDEFLGQDPAIPGTQYAEKTFAIEQYAKGVGLIYREFVHWEFQGSQSISPGFTGFGIKMTIIDHN